MTGDERPTSSTPGLPVQPRYPETSDDAQNPLWVPRGVDLEVVPEEVRQAIAEVVQPVYQRCVLETDDPLEKSLGVTVAHLLWLEILQQFDLKREYVQVSAVLGVSEDRGALIEQHLRIIYSKVKVGYFLARIRELRLMWEQRSAGAPSVPSLPSGGHAALPTPPSRDSSPAATRSPDPVVARSPDRATKAPNEPEAPQHGKTASC